MSRSNYVARLRRAFLLRAHPDRFRSHGESIRHGQAKLLQVLSERMSSPDFAAYSCYEQALPSWTGKPYCRYVLERRDGSLLQQTIQLDSPVENVLKNMADALYQCGVGSVPRPPSPEEDQKVIRGASFIQESKDTFNSASQIDHRFDINTLKGRDLSSFLRVLDPDLVASRKASRMDAKAASLVVRRLFQFQAVDGTTLGWSSSSLAMLLSSMVDMHEEFHSKFHVQNFYPLRLIFTHDDFREAVDLYGGAIRLNPSATPIQWLETLQLVRPESLEMLRRNRNLLEARIRRFQNALNVQVTKGHSCCSEEYHMFMKRMDQTLQPLETKLHTSSLVTQRVVVTVESSQACRRSKVTNQGTIRVGASMSPESVVTAISRRSEEAREKLAQEKEERKRCQAVVDQVQWQLGLQKVYRTGVVSHEQYLGCLSRILQTELKMELKRCLGGNSLGVAGHGFCRLADDGSVIVPFDWR